MAALAGLYSGTWKQHRDRQASYLLPSLIGQPANMPFEAAESRFRCPTTATYGGGMPGRWPYTGPVLSTVKYSGASEGLSVLEPATRETVRQHQALGYKTPDQIYRR